MKSGKKSKRKVGRAYRKVKMKKLKKAARKAFKGNRDHS